MYLRVTERRNRDGSTVAYYALAENVWNAQTKRSEAQVIHTFGRADQLDKAALQRLVASIQHVIDADAAGAIATRDKASLPDIEIEVFEDLQTAEGNAELSYRYARHRLNPSRRRRRCRARTIAPK